MIRQRLRSTLIVACILLLCFDGQSAPAQVSPDASLQTLETPDDINVSLWASEPMVNNPTAMEVDSRGRVWIAEGMNYRMKMKEFADLKRVEGADRIRILEDTDGDGKADKVTDFADGIFPVPLGMAVEEIWNGSKQVGTRVYIGNSPDMLVLEDTDGDDVADQRYALLSGFRGVDSDHGLHGMTFGLDGRLYFTVGDGRYGADNVQAHDATFDVTDQSGRRVSANNFGTTLRVNRDGTQLEVLSSGHRNNYETAVDSFGNVFGSDNDDDGNRGCRMYWVMDGGEYGYQHPRSTRHWAEELPGIIPKLVGTGNGAPGGLIVYEGGALPERYQDSVLQIDSGTHQLNVFPLQRYGAGFRSDYQVLLRGNDDWFRPIDVAVAPDGAVLVCDWYDAGVGGNRFSDQDTGRIYRLSDIVGTKPTTFDPTNPIAGLQSPNLVTRLAARDRLVARGAEARPELLALFQSSHPSLRARALQVLFAMPGTGREDALSALRDPDARIRETALKLLAGDTSREWVVPPAIDRSATPPAMMVLDSILPLASDEDAGVRRALMMSLRNVPTESIASELWELVDGWDGRDRYYLEAVRAVLRNRDPSFIQDLLNKLTDQAIQSGWNESPVAAPPYYPIGTNDAYLKIGDEIPPSNHASRLIGLAWALGSSDALPSLDKVLSENRSSYVEHAAIRALSQIAESRAGELLLERFLSPNVTDGNRLEILEVLTGKVTGDWQDLQQNPLLSKVIHAALANQQLSGLGMEVIGQAGFVEYADDLMSLVTDEQADQQTRATALVVLGDLRHAPARDLASELLQAVGNSQATRPVQHASLELLAAMSGTTEVAPYVVNQNIPLELRRRAMQLVAVNQDGASSLIQQFKTGAMPPELSSELTFLLRNHSDSRVRRLAEQELPGSTPQAGRTFDPSLLLTIHGDANRGKQLFEKDSNAACAKCHRTTGEGNLVGPDLASIGMKYGARELLYHIQYPSAAINYNFVSSNILMNDGRALTGLVLKRDQNQIQLGLATGQIMTIAVDEIESERNQSISLMPEGLIANFSDQQVADLLEYLITLRQGDVGEAQ